MVGTLVHDSVNVIILDKSNRIAEDPGRLVVALPGNAYTVAQAARSDVLHCIEAHDKR